MKHPTMDRKTPATQYSAQRVTSTTLDAERNKTSLDCITSVEWREGSQHVHSNGKLLGSHQASPRARVHPQLVHMLILLYDKYQPPSLFLFLKQDLDVQSKLASNFQYSGLSLSHAEDYRHLQPCYVLLFFPSFFWRQGLIKPLLD